MRESESLFSYGISQYPEVQQETFGRLIQGSSVTLPGYYLTTIQIDDPEVIRKSGETVHKIMERSNKADNQIHGVVLQITPQELENADTYEVSDYKRIKVTLKSELQTSVYVKKTEEPFQ